MTDTVINACETAQAEGGGLACSQCSHDNWESTLIGHLPDYMQIVRSWSRPLMMMKGVEIDSYLGAMPIGYVWEVMAEELKALGFQVGQRRVGRLMRQNNITVLRTRKFK